MNQWNRRRCEWWACLLTLFVLVFSVCTLRAATLSVSGVAQIYFSGDLGALAIGDQVNFAFTYDDSLPVFRIGGGTIYGGATSVAVSGVEGNTGNYGNYFSYAYADESNLNFEDGAQWNVRTGPLFQPAGNLGTFNGVDLSLIALTLSGSDTPVGPRGNSPSLYEWAGNQHFLPTFEQFPDKVFIMRAERMGDGGFQALGSVLSLSSEVVPDLPGPGVPEPSSMVASAGVLLLLFLGKKARRGQ